MIRDRFRTLLNIRVPRESAPIGAKPPMGGKITLGGMRMLVTSTPVDELWHFFSLQGWREVVHSRDRRRYTDLPRVSFDLLARCSSNERAIRYRQLVAMAARSQAKPNLLSATSGAAGGSDES